MLEVYGRGARAVRLIKPNFQTSRYSSAFPTFCVSLYPCGFKIQWTGNNVWSWGKWSVSHPMARGDILLVSDFRNGISIAVLKLY
jgi:hypothetical protein